MKKNRLLTIFTVFMIVCSFGFSQEKEVTTYKVGGLTFEGIPKIPLELEEEYLRLQEKFSNERPMTLSDVIPQKGGLLVVRYSEKNNMEQFFSLDKPGGAFKQITNFEYPIRPGLFSSSKKKHLRYKILFLVDTSHGKNLWQIAIYDLTTRKFKIISKRRDLRHEAPLWNDAGTEFVYSQWDENVTRVILVEAKNPNKQKIIFEAKGIWLALDFSSRKEIVLKKYYSSTTGSLRILNAKTGKKILITPVKGKYQLALLDRSRKKSLYCVLADDVADGFYSLYRRNYSKNKLYIVASPIQNDIEGASVSYDGLGFEYTVNKGISEMHLFYKSKPVQLSGISGVLRGYNFSSDSKFFSFMMSTIQQPNSLYTVEMETGKVQSWIDPTVQDIQVEIIQYKSFDGLRVSANIYSSKSKKNGKSPVVYIFHGGPAIQERPGYSVIRNLLVARGYIVIAPNFRGSTGFGDKFKNLGKRELLPNTVKDATSLLEWCRKNVPEQDMNNVFVMGGSFGGFLALSFINENADVVKAGIVRAPITDFYTYFKKTAKYRVRINKKKYGDPENPQIAKMFDEINPTNNADSISKVPMFFIHGEEDSFVSFDQSRNMVNILRKKGGKVWFLQVENEGHKIKNGTNIAVHERLSLYFYDRYRR